MENYRSIPNNDPDWRLEKQELSTEGKPDGNLGQQYPRPKGRGALNEYIYPQNLPEALKLIGEAVAGETEDRMFYQYLLETAPSDEDKEIIKGIREDEIRHFTLFKQVYFMLTRQLLAPSQDPSFEKPSAYCEGLKRAIQGEQNAIIKYRRILYALQDRILINILTGIITDETRHGLLYNYLYSKNGCRI